MYIWLKLAHIIAVITFLGNITTGLFWHHHAARTRDPRILAHTMGGIIRSDRLFTIPGVIGILGAGVAMAVAGHHSILGTAWILWTVVLFSISGLAFMLRVAPLQRELHALADVGAGLFDHDRYDRVARRWEFWGGVALFTPVLGLFLMVLKPT